MPADVAAPPPPPVSKDSVDFPLECVAKTLPTTQATCAMYGRPPRETFAAFDGDVLLLGLEADRLTPVVALGGALVQRSGSCCVRIREWGASADHFVELVFDDDRQASHWTVSLKQAATELEPPPSRVVRLRKLLDAQSSKADELAASVARLERELADGMPKEAIQPMFARDTAGELPAAALNNIMLLTASGKVAQHVQYPPGTELVQSSFQCIGGASKDVCFFGLQYYLRRHLSGAVVTPTKIEEADRLFAEHFAHPVYGRSRRLFNRRAWDYIARRHGGLLPISIKAVLEGSVLSAASVMFTVENTDPQCYWLPSYLEGVLLQVWYPTTICTLSREYKRLIVRYLGETGCGDTVHRGEHLFKLHDFGFGEASSVESSALGGAAHLVHFLGGDALPALHMFRGCYGEPCAGFSAPAAELGSLLAWGREREVDAMRNLFDQHQEGLIACVCGAAEAAGDLVDLLGAELRDAVERREGVVMVKVEAARLPEDVISLLQRLEAAFGHERTQAGFKRLPPWIRLLYSGGTELGTMELLLEAMKQSGWAADSVAFGCGGARLPGVRREFLQCGFKYSHARVNGQDVRIAQDLEGEVGQAAAAGPSAGALVEVFRDGRLLVDDTLDSIRLRASGQIVPPRQPCAPPPVGRSGPATVLEEFEEGEAGSASDTGDAESSDAREEPRVLSGAVWEALRTEAQASLDAVALRAEVDRLKAEQVQESKSLKAEVAELREALAAARAESTSARRRAATADLALPPGSARLLPEIGSPVVRLLSESGSPIEVSPQGRRRLTSQELEALHHRLAAAEAKRKSAEKQLALARQLAGGAVLSPSSADAAAQSGAGASPDASGSNLPCDLAVDAGVLSGANVAAPEESSHGGLPSDSTVVVCTRAGEHSLVSGSTRSPDSRHTVDAVAAAVANAGAPVAASPHGLEAVASAGAPPGAELSIAGPRRSHDPPPEAAAGGSRDPPFSAGAALGAE